MDIARKSHRRSRIANWRVGFCAGTGVPPEAEEVLAGLLDKDELERAAALARLLIDTYEGYAEGHNYLGLIALRRGDLKAAEFHFRSTMTVARSALPAKVRRASWWRDLATRPYVRGLRNLTLTLSLAGRWDDAATYARQLHDECADSAASDVFLASISLSTGRYHDALERASRVRIVWPEEGFVAAFAAAELSSWPEALETFLHAAIHARGSVPSNAQRSGTLGVQRNTRAVPAAGMLRIRRTRWTFLQPASALKQSSPRSISRHVCGSQALRSRSTLHCSCRIGMCRRR